MNRDEALNILGLSRKYTEEDLKQQYRRLARKYHPDIAGMSYTEKFAKINEAYETLSKLGPSVGCILTHINIFDVTRA